MDTVLQDRQSFAAFDRQKMRQCFESKAAMRERYTDKKATRHTPTVRTWDEDAVLAAAHAWPTGSKVNWSHFAAEHGICGANRGQIVKEFLRESSVNILAMECRDETAVRMRRQRVRYRCGVTQPVQPTTDQIKSSIREAVESGRYTPGEECTGTVLCRYKLSNGKVRTEKIPVHGRKIPMIEVRRRLLQRHEEANLMRDHVRSLQEYASMPREEVVSSLEAIGEHDDTTDDTDVSELSSRLYIFRHTRLLLLGHDHADLLGHSYLVEVIKVVYDQAMHLTDDEYKDRYGTELNLQAQIEQPEVRLLSMIGSSEEEQLRVIPDRAEDLHHVRAPIDRKHGDPLVDAIVGFAGDHQARWFEAGVQKGGAYTCGSGCGALASMYPWYPTNANSQIPSMAELQRRATSGTFGRKAGFNLHSLTAVQTRIELEDRGMKDVTALDAKEAKQTLRGLLRGVQRVPALLAFRPQRPLEDLALERYCIMPCEPLHDLKGHIDHVLTELPLHLDHDDAAVVEEVVSATINRDHSRGCDWRKALFLVAAALDDTSAPGKVKRMVALLAEVCGILYAGEAQRSPKKVLHLSLPLAAFHSSPRDLRHRQVYVNL